MFDQGRYFFYFWFNIFKFIEPKKLAVLKIHHTATQFPKQKLLWKKRNFRLEENDAIILGNGSAKF